MRVEINAYEEEKLPMKFRYDEALFADDNEISTAKITIKDDDWGK